MNVDPHGLAPMLLGVLNSRATLKVTLNVMYAGMYAKCNYVIQIPDSYMSYKKLT